MLYNNHSYKINLPRSTDAILPDMYDVQEDVPYSRKFLQDFIFTELLWVVLQN